MSRFDRSVVGRSAERAYAQKGTTCPDAEHSIERVSVLFTMMAWCGLCFHPGILVLIALFDCHPHHIHPPPLTKVEHTATAVSCAGGIHKHQILHRCSPSSIQQAWTVHVSGKLHTPPTSCTLRRRTRSKLSRGHPQHTSLARRADERGTAGGGGERQHRMRIRRLEMKRHLRLVECTQEQQWTVHVYLGGGHVNSCCRSSCGGMYHLVYGIF